jgi:hypothetical protein
MLELKLGLNDKLLFEAHGRAATKGKSIEMEDIKFHQCAVTPLNLPPCHFVSRAHARRCVRLARFDVDRTIVTPFPSSLPTANLNTCTASRTQGLQPVADEHPFADVS